MNYQSTFTLSPEAGAVGTWQFDASLIPHPVCFMYTDKTTSVANTEATLLNSQLAGITHNEKFLAFKALAQRWRLAYMSVTVYQDGPDLANQGTIVVAQPPVSPRKRFVSQGALYVVSGNPLQGTPILMPPQLCQWTAEDRPDFTRSQAMPNAYFNRSKEGAYVPLKLTETCQDWSSEEHEIGIAEFQPHGDAFSTGILALGGTTAGAFPFPDLQPTRSVGPYMYGQATSAPLSGNWAHISARNLAVTTSYSFFVRCGIEMQVSPSSTLSPQLKLSPPYDPVALSTYFSICRELKDAYPADYNTTGKLWGVIRQALNSMDPFIRVLPGGKFLSAGLQTGAQIGDLAVARRKKKNRKNKNRKRQLRGKPKKQYPKNPGYPAPKPPRQAPAVPPR